MYLLTLPSPSFSPHLLSPLTLSVVPLSGAPLSVCVQMEQLRSELMQERSSRQDLELDKNALERHVR